MSIICLDTNIVVWGIQRHSSSDRQENIPKAEALMNQLEANRNHIIIPAPVFAELLMGCNPQDNPRVMEEISRRTKIVPFDVPASIEYGKIHINKWGLREELGIQREKMKIDMMVLAVALAQKASCIYSEDDDIHKLGKEIIEVRRMPRIALQGNLLDAQNT